MCLRRFILIHQVFKYQHFTNRENFHFLWSSNLRTFFICNILSSAIIFHLTFTTRVFSHQNNLTSFRCPRKNWNSILYYLFLVLLQTSYSTLALFRDLSKSYINKYISIRQVPVCTASLHLLINIILKVFPRYFSITIVFCGCAWSPRLVSFL